MISRLVAPALLCVALASSASAQTAFFAHLTGAQEVPTTGSANTGTGIFYYDPPTKTLTYDITITGLTGTFTAAHIHLGTPGISGGIIVALAGGPTHFAGSTVLSAANETNLLTGALYTNVHSTTFPNGEIRGQISPATRRTFVVLDGARETPPNGSAGTATGLITLNADNSVSYAITYSGLSSTVTAAHIHDGISGVPGGIIVALTLAGAGSISGTTAPQTDVTIEKIRTSRAYVNIHTTSFPGGEIRGQTVPSFTPYGAGCPSSLGFGATLGGSGIPTSNSLISIDVSNGKPFGTGLLFVGFTATDIAMGYGCRLYMTPSPLLTLSMPPLNAAGGVSVPIVLPVASPAISLQLEYAGIDAAVVPAGFYTSNGLTLHIDN